MKKSNLFLLGVLAAALTLMFTGCPTGGGGGDPDPTWTVTVTPADPALLQGTSNYKFNAVLKKNGTAVIGSYTTEWAVTGTSNANTKFGTDSTSDKLSIAADETAATLTVTATVDYQGATYTGTTTVTVKTAAAAKEDFEDASTAVSGATSAGALLDALKTLDAYIDSSLLNSDFADVYYTAKTAIATMVQAITSATDDVQGAIEALNNLLGNIAGGQLLTEFNAATSASGVKTLLDKLFGYGFNDFDTYKAMYDSLSSTYKMKVATAVYNGGDDYDNVEDFQDAIGDSLVNVYYEAIFKAPLDAVLTAAKNENLTLAQINAFLAKCNEVGAPELTVTANDVAAIQTAIKALIAQDGEGEDDESAVYAYLNSDGEFTSALMEVYYAIYQVVLLKAPLDAVLTAAAGDRLSLDQINALLEAMSEMGEDEDEEEPELTVTEDDVDAIQTAIQGLIEQDGEEDDEESAVYAYQHGTGDIMSALIEVMFAIAFANIGS